MSQSTRRAVLGPADLDDDQLAEVVARSFGAEAEDVEVLSSSAEVVDYDLDAITTAGRYWVRGDARVAGRERPFSFFVKHVQCWSRTPMFAFVPEEFREQARASVPWRTEATVYRSDLAARLPDGLAMPAAYAVLDLDEESAAVWMEAVPAVDVVWDVERHARAAYLLGRLAASERVRPIGRLGAGRDQPSVRTYAAGRVAVQLTPALRDDAVWSHPLVSPAFDDDLRLRLLDALDRLWEIVEELEGIPFGTAHGDACPRNLLVREGSDDFVLIDYGFWGEAPYGFDLAQLLVGQVQVGERPASDLPALEAACVPAYCRGLRDEGVHLEESVVRRAHALQMLLFTGLSGLPFEHLGSEPTTELHQLAAARAETTRFILDLADATR